MIYLAAWLNYGGVEADENGSCYSTTNIALRARFLAKTTMHARSLRQVDAT